MKRMGRCLLLALTAVWAAPLSAQSFGNSVTVGDREVFVGEPTHEMRPGVVYVFRPDGQGGWAQAQRLEATDGMPGDRFGIRSTLHDDELYVSATRIDGGTGAVYVFRKDGDTWAQAGKLITDDRSPADSLGSGLAVDDEWAMIGTIGQNGGAGAVYAFRRNGDDWVQHSKLAPTNLQAENRFGSTVALQDGWALVGAPARADGQGAVYAFQYDAASDTWQARGNLQAPGLQPQTAMGSDIALQGGNALVTAPGFLQGMGIVFSYSRTDGAWELDAMLSPFQMEPGGQFGSSLAFDGESALIGTPGAASGEGRVYVFRKDAASGEWTEARKVGPSGLTAQDFFAATVDQNEGVAVAASLGQDYGAGAAYVLERTADGWETTSRIAGEVLGLDAVTGDEVTCSEEETAAGFACSSVDLLSFLPLSDMGADRGVRVNDTWGWTDPQTGQEIALVGMTNQTVFVDVTNPGSPTYLGRLPMPDEANGSTWRDMKVYSDHMYVVSDGAGPHGMQVFDLTRLRELDGSDPETFEADAHYDRINSAHNIVINEETGFAYAVGASAGGDTCGGGLHMIDIRDPKSPTFAGCFQDTATGRQRTGYSHDAQCVVYRGPDTDYQGNEICFGSNETALSIADVTDKENPVALSTATYPNVAYSHQGWVSEDHAYFFMNDELDEMGGGVSNTRTLVWDISDLDDPILANEYFHETRAIDHNLYVLGNTMYQSNYTSGLRVLDVSDPVNPRPVGHFDTVPYGGDEAEFNGSWSNYPYFESGVVIVTSQREGLFVVRYRPRSVS
ncbi:MAG: choice-of-anchor B family protein [Gemmatimonadota bacterium]